MFVLSLIAITFFAEPALAVECHGSPEFALQELKSFGADPDERSESGQCLIRHYLDKPEVALAALKVIRNPREDLLLREDLIQAFAESPLRRKVKVEQALSPELKPEDNAALSRTVASAEGLLAVTSAVKSMRETVPVTRFETEFFRALSEIAMDDTNHVILREVAVAALEKAASRVVASGLYDDRNIRLAQETLRTVAARADNSSFMSGAEAAYGRLAAAGLPHFAPAEPAPGRMLSSKP